jgi:uncharacterized protein YerC
MTPSLYRREVDATKRRLLIAALRKHRTYRAAGKALGISFATCFREARRLQIRVTTVTNVEVA